MTSTQRMRFGFLTSDSIWMIDFRCDDVLVIIAVEIGSTDGFDFVVGPVNQTIDGIVVYGDCVFHPVKMKYHI